MRHVKGQEHIRHKPHEAREHVGHVIQQTQECNGSFNMALLEKEINNLKLVLRVFRLYKMKIEKVHPT